MKDATANAGTFKMYLRGNGQPAHVVNGRERMGESGAVQARTSP